MTDNPFYEVAALLVIAALGGAIAVRLRQPLIISFILVGILAGPVGVGVVTAHEPIELLAGLGITILLFLVGLKLDLGLVRSLGPVAIATGLGQLTFTIAFGYLIAMALGFDAVTAVYIAVALTFSSTIIIVKLLSDKREIDSLHGRIAMGFLIVQDIAVVIAMAALGSFAVEVPYAFADPVLLPVFLAAAALVVGLLMRYVLPGVLHALARSTELLYIFAFAWGTFLAALGDAVGFSREVGAFLAGFSLASTGYREVIGARLASLRDFLLLFFFIDLGSRLEFVAVGETLLHAGIFSAFILVGNPLIVLMIMGLLGYSKRTGFLAGLTVAQISEFSLIFIALGITIGHIAPEVMGLVTVVGLVTITASTYMILYSQKLYPLLERWLGVFERRNPQAERRFEEELRGGQEEVEFIVFGVGRFGKSLIKLLSDQGRGVLGVDIDPDAVRTSCAEGLRVRFGDAADPEYLVHLPLDRALWVVSSLPDRDLNLVLLDTLRREGSPARVAVTAHVPEDAGMLREQGADFVMMPFQDAATLAATMIAGGEQASVERGPG